MTVRDLKWMLERVPDTHLVLVIGERGVLCDVMDVEQNEETAYLNICFHDALNDANVPVDIRLLDGPAAREGVA